MNKYYKAEDVEKLLSCGCAYAIRDLPTIDIVLCKECKSSDPNNEGDYDCKRRIPIFRVDADGWCYLGEREEE